MGKMLFVSKWYIHGVFLSVESVQTAAEDPAAGQSGPEPEAEDGQRAVRAVCQGDDVWAGFIHFVAVCWYLQKEVEVKLMLMQVKVVSVGVIHARFDSV